MNPVYYKWYIWTNGWMYYVSQRPHKILVWCRHENRSFENFEIITNPSFCLGCMRILKNLILTLINPKRKIQDTTQVAIFHIPVFFVLHFDYDVVIIKLRGWKSSEATACKGTANVASWMTKVLKESTTEDLIYLFLLKWF